MPWIESIYCGWWIHYIAWWADGMTWSSSMLLPGSAPAHQQVRLSLGLHSPWWHTRLGVSLHSSSGLCSRSSLTLTRHCSSDSSHGYFTQAFLGTRLHWCLGWAFLCVLLTILHRITSIVEHLFWGRGLGITKLEISIVFLFCSKHFLTFSILHSG